MLALLNLSKYLYFDWGEHMKTIIRIIFFILLLAVVLTLSSMFATEALYAALPMPPANKVQEVHIEKPEQHPIEPEVEPQEPIEQEVVYQATNTTTPTTPTTPTQAPPDITGIDADIAAIARTLSGECYDHNTTDKRGVAEVILNRASKGYGTVTDVVTAPNQFMGYYNQSRNISDSDWEIATQAVNDWYANDCQAMSDYLYFGSGGGDSNVFRESY